MGTIADKLSYLNDTKTLLRRGINALGGDLTTNDTFRSYANALDNIYDYLPKVTGTGTSVTLDGVRDGGLRINPNPSALSQTTYTGKNLFDSSTAVQSPYGYHNNTGTLTHIDNNTIKIVKGEQNTDKRMSISNDITLSSGTTITISWEYGTGNGNIIGQLQAYSTSNSVVNLTTLNNNGLSSPQTITLSSDIKYIWLATSWNNHSDLVVKNIQIEKNNSKTSFEPYCGGIASPNPSYPQDIHINSGNNSVVVNGKNLIKIPDGAKTIGNLTLTFSNGIGTFSGTYSSSGTMAFDTDFTILAGTYTLSSNMSSLNYPYVTLIDENNTKIAVTSYSSQTITFTITETKRITMVTFYCGGDRAYNIVKPQLEVGSTATSFEPYIYQTAPINLGVENLFDIDNLTMTNGYYDNSGTYTSNNANGCFDFISVKSGEPYTFSVSSEVKNITIVEFNNSQTFIKKTQLSNVSVNSLTLDSNTKYIKITINLNNSTKVTKELVKDIKPQLEKGTKANSYTPYGTTPIELGIIPNTNYSNEFVRSNGKNLLLNTLLTTATTKNGITATPNNDGSVSLSGTSTATTYFNLTNTDFGTTSFNSVYGGSTEYVASTGNTNTNIRIAYDNGNKYTYIQVNNGTTTNITIFPMINKGTTALPYVPYEKGWYIKKNIGKYAINTGNITARTSYTNIDYAQIPKPTDAINYNVWGHSQVLCNKATWSNSTSTLDSVDNIGIIFTGTAQNVYWVGFSKNTALSSMKTQLEGTIIYYILATPTYTKITGELANQLEQVYKGMLSYDGVTNISQVNNDLAFDFDITALKELEESEG